MLDMRAQSYKIKQKIRKDYRMFKNDKIVVS